MNFKTFEYSRVMQLCTFARPEGQFFLPMVAAKIAARYSFQKAPTLDQLVAPTQTYTFLTGAFGDYGIQDLSIYSNGIVVTAGISTTVIEAFMSDLLAWAEKELGVKDTGIPPKERHYESAIIVEMDIRSQKALVYLEQIAPALRSYLDSYGNPNFRFDFGGFSVAVDSTKYAGAKPVAFTLQKRINVPFEANIYYSTAPLMTDHHLQILEKIERFLS